VTVLSIPGFGTGWYRRGLDYWMVRGIRLALAAGVVIVQLLLHELILADDPHATRFGTEWWGVVGFGVLATAEGFRMAFVSRALPFGKLLDRPGKLLRALIVAPLVVYLLSTLVLAPGAFLGATIDAMRPNRNERIARADLDAQLRARQKRR
jgi:hypothetical protein